MEKYKLVLATIICFFVFTGGTTVIVQPVHHNRIPPAGGATVTIAGTESIETGNWWTGGGRCYGWQYVASATATLKTGYFYMHATDTEDGRMCVYDSGENLIATSDINTSFSTGWNTFTFTGAEQVTITSGNTYRLGLHLQGVINARGSGSGSASYDNEAWSTPPDPWAEAGTTAGGGSVSIYIEGTT